MKKLNQISAKKRITGQGMTEYIIIVALIAIAAITVYSLFGKTMRTQVGNLAQELGGVEQGDETVDNQVDTVGNQEKKMGSFGTTGETK